MSRKSGDQFEYRITKLIINQGVKFSDTKSKDKFNKWEPQFKYVSYSIPIDFKLYTTIRLCTDKEGCTGSNADMILINATDSLAISLKNNNLSIKHPRPSSIYKQLVKPLQVEYVDKYAALNAKYYKLAIDNGYTAFEQFSANEKIKMYREFIQLLYGMCRRSRKSCISLFKFCTGVHDKNQVVIKQQKGKITCYKCKEIDYDGVVKIKKISYNSFHINVSGVCIKFRIHTASKRVTKTLSLKYSVDPVNIDDLFIAF